MAMLAASPTPPAGFNRDYAWEAPRIPQHQSRPAQESRGTVSLPSIRMFFPELQLVNGSSSTQHPEPAAAPSSSIGPSPTSAIPPSMASPSYVHSSVSHKRRRDSVDDDQERARARHVPRVYYSPDRDALRPPSSGRHRALDSWSQSRKSSFSHREHAHPAMGVNERVEARTALPSLSTSLPSAERSAAPRAHPSERYEEYSDRCRSGSIQHGLPPPLDTGSRYGSSSYEYGTSRNSQMHSLSTSPIHNNSYDRTPFSAGAYVRPFGEYPRYQDLGHAAALAGDGKQRKRRGNLPKETTDKLRAWFMAHLSHPYPTEDEKQELMRQTGLQMNQISNWFINARRRQLPTMINNARVETEAMNARLGDKILPTTERHDLENSGYDEDIKAYQHQRPHSLKRGSV